MRQLNFPQDYVIPPELPVMGHIPGLDHIYILTVQRKYPERYEYACKWAKNMKNVTIWPGILINELTDQDLEMIQYGLGRSHPDVCVSRDHIAIWREASKKYNRILILEDMS